MFTSLWFWPFFFPVFRGLLPFHLLALDVWVHLIFFPLYTFFLRRFHPVLWMEFKASFRELGNKSSSNSHFIRGIMKVSLLWMHSILINILGLAGNWAGSQSQLDCTTLYSCPASQSPLDNAVAVILVFRFHIIPALKTGFHLLYPSLFPLQPGDSYYRIKNMYIPGIFFLHSHDHHLA